jgi:hypothetical protein
MLARIDGLADVLPNDLPLMLLLFVAALFR